MSWRPGLLRSSSLALRTLLVLLLASCVTAPRPQAHGTRTVRFKILQINDVYKIEGLEGGKEGGLARVRWLRRQLESDGTRVLVLHGGDLLYPSVMSKYLEAKPMVDVMNLLDGDERAFDESLMVGFGNHELDKSDDRVLLARLKDSQFEWVATNTYHCTAPDQCSAFRSVGDTVAEVMVVDVGGRKIGVMGFLYPLSKPYAHSTNVIPAARDAVDVLLQSGVDVFVAITHEDMADDVRLAQELPRIDFIIGGHDHLFTQQKVGNTWITKADADAKSAIVYDITIDGDGGAVSAPLRVALDSSMPKDPAVDARVQQWLGKLGDQLGGTVTLGTTKTLLEGVEPAVRGRETALGNLLTDVAREHMGTDIAILNGGSIRINDNIPPGPITNYDMEGIFYYTNTIVAFPLTGAQLLDVLRNAVSRADAGDGRFLQVSGLRFAYSGQNGVFTVAPEDVRIGDKPLDLGATYRVASIDYLYLHGTEDGYTLFADATRPPKLATEREADFRKTVEETIRTRGTVDIGIEGRIVRK
jgi:2',3'-cyclic-nucleotide 2'-phosphodiesterase (5'-nucleotidase family)